MLRLFGALWAALVTVPAAADQPAYIIELPPTVQDVYVAAADTATLHRFSQDGGALIAAGDSYMSIGRNGVGKQRAWDRRTPLGIYFIVDELDTSRMHEKYGVAAFPLDYPNVRDRQLGRSGDGIWVHGVLPGGQRPPKDTDGCVALPNENIAALATTFVPLSTPVILAREMRWQPAADLAALRAELRTALELWQRSQSTGDWQSYLANYADDFSYRGLARAEWAALRAQNFAGTKRLQVDDLLLLADPEEAGLYLSRFRLLIQDAAGERGILKRLYWRRGADGRLRIVAEDNG